MKPKKIEREYVVSLLVPVRVEVGVETEDEVVFQRVLKEEMYELASRIRMDSFVVGHTEDGVSYWRSAKVKDKVNVIGHTHQVPAPKPAKKAKKRK